MKGILKIQDWMARFAAQLKREDGMATVEYAIVLTAAAGFAGMLVLLMKSDFVADLLKGMIEGALQPAGE